MSERDVVNCRPLGFVKKLGVAWGIGLGLMAVLWTVTFFVANRRTEQGLAEWKALGLASTVEEFEKKKAAIPDETNAAAALSAAAVQLQVPAPQQNGFVDMRKFPPPAEWMREAAESRIKNAAAIQSSVAAVRLKQTDWKLNYLGRSPFDLQRPLNLAMVLVDEAIWRNLHGDDAGAFEMLETAEAIAEGYESQPARGTFIAACGSEALRLSFVPPIAAEMRVGVEGDSAGQVSEARVRAMVSRLKRPLFKVRPDIWEADFVSYEKALTTPGQRGWMMIPARLGIRATLVELQLLRVRAGEAMLTDDELGDHLFSSIATNAEVVRTAKRTQLSRAFGVSALMVAIYRSRHGGGWPETREEIEAACGEPFPADPFHPEGERLEYRRHGPERRAVVVGRNSGGFPSVEPTQLPDWLDRIAPPVYRPMELRRRETNSWLDLTRYPRPTER